MILLTVVVVVVKGDWLVEWQADKCFTTRSPGNTSSLICSICQFLWCILVHSLHGRYQTTNRKSPNTELWTDAISCCEPSRLLNILFLFSFCTMFNFLSYSLLVHGNIFKGTISSLFDFSLKQQCFFTAAISGAVHFKPLCYSWCFELLSQIYV